MTRGQLTPGRMQVERLLEQNSTCDFSAREVAARTGLTLKECQQHLGNATHFRKVHNTQPVGQPGARYKFGPPPSTVATAWRPPAGTYQGTELQPYTGRPGAMLTPQFLLPHPPTSSLVDLFAGGGGASTGIEQAIGRPVDVAINHDPEAVSLHQANHPQTLHYVSDVYAADPATVAQGRPIGLLWASPDCTYHSKARGGKPHRDRNKARRRRALAWVVVRWAKLPKGQRPRIISMENVEEWQHWGPLLDDGQPCPERRGQSFQRWKKQLENLGYVVEHRELRGCDYGAPTIRKRLFLIARCDGQPIVWPAPTHGAPDSLPVKAKKLKPWRTAAECIDWSQPVPVDLRARPAAGRGDAAPDRQGRDAVRGERGRAVHRAAHGYGERAGARSHRQHPIRTIAPRWRQQARARGRHYRPFLTEHANASSQRNFGANEPLRTQVAQVKGGHFALVSAFLAKHYGGVVGTRVDVPSGTVTTQDHHSDWRATSIQGTG
jgi:DNA (cytosine-5)-methyltransferase 1